MGKNRQRNASRTSNDSSVGSTSSGGKSLKQNKKLSQSALTKVASAAAAAAGASSTFSSSSSSSTNPAHVWRWLYAERQGVVWVVGCAFIGAVIGFGIGSGYLTGDFRRGRVAPWRVALGGMIRGSAAFRALTLQSLVFQRSGIALDIRKDPSNPIIFAQLREAVIREEGGHVNPDLGMMIPAPSGAVRGIGMVRNSYTECQMRCFPGLGKEVSKLGKGPYKTANASEAALYRQEEVLIRIPLSYQMTRTLAVDTLIPLLPENMHKHSRNIADLDDAAILTIYLAHERGLGRSSKWFPYIASMPPEPSCGYSEKARPYMLDSLVLMRDEMGIDVNGWSFELARAGKYADKIVNALTRDFGSYIKHPSDITPNENFAWALCQVASRATAGSEKHGALRMVPVLDLINHDAAAGGFIELTGKEKLKAGQFIDANETDSGTFVVRSIRHGRRKPLRKGQELMANYNVPGYTPLDWFVSLGFVPPERWHSWQKLDPVLPKVRTDGPFGPEKDENEDPILSKIHEKFGRHETRGNGDHENT